MGHSVIISYYKNLANLELILIALKTQSDTDFEVIIAEDDANPETEVFIENYRQKVSYPIIHVNQTEDLGFRKNSILNKAIKASTGDFLIFIDCDCIPNRHFIKQYNKLKTEDAILYGRRVMVGETVSNDAKTSKSVSKLNFWSLLFTDAELKKEGLYLPYFSITLKKRGLLGCNWGVYKKHLEAVNGFDEDYVFPGVGEDVDIEWRLKAIGLEMKSIKNKAIVFHMYHPRSYSEDGVQHNYRLMDAKQKENLVYCQNGLNPVTE